MIIVTCDVCKTEKIELLISIFQKIIGPWQPALAKGWILNSREQVCPGCSFKRRNAGRVI